MRFPFNDLEIHVYTQFGDAIGPILMVDGEAIIEWDAHDWWIADIALGLGDTYIDCADVRRHTQLSVHHNGMDWLRSLVRANLENKQSDKIETWLVEACDWVPPDPHAEHRLGLRELV